MIYDVAAAVKTHFDSSVSSALKADLSGGLYFSQAPQDVSYPYGVYKITGSSVDDYLGSASDKFENVNLSIECFSSASDGGVEIAEISRELANAFDWQTLALPASATETFVKLSRTGFGSFTVEDDIRKFDATYLFLVDG